MSKNTFVDWDAASKRLKRFVGISSSTGISDANKIVTTDSSGKLDASLIPDMTSSVENITIADGLTISDRSFVNVYDATGRRVRKAIAADGTKPVSGYVGVGGSAPGNVNVVFRGPVTLNTADVQGGGIVAGSVDLPVFLSSSTAGAVTLTPPEEAGSIIQYLGKIIEIGGDGTFRIYLDPEIPIENPA